MEAGMQYDSEHDVDEARVGAKMLEPQIVIVVETLGAVSSGSLLF